MKLTDQDDDIKVGYQIRNNMIKWVLQSIFHRHFMEKVSIFMQFSVPYEGITSVQGNSIDELI